MPTTFTVSSVRGGLIFSCCFLSLNKSTTCIKVTPATAESSYECWSAQWRPHQCPWIQKRCIIWRHRKTSRVKTVHISYNSLLASSLVSCFLFTPFMGEALMNESRWILLFIRIPIGTIATIILPGSTCKIFKLKHILFSPVHPKWMSFGLGENQNHLEEICKHRENIWKSTLKGSGNYTNALSAYSFHDFITWVFYFLPINRWLDKVIVIVFQCYKVPTS